MLKSVRLVFYICLTPYLIFSLCGNEKIFVKCSDTCDEPPLILTPYIESGEIERARNLSRVHNLPGTSTLQSYTGFLTVNKTCNSNLFFWFFPSKVNFTTAPVELWLQGGPDHSSLFALFEQNGPIYVNDKLELGFRNYSWTNTNSLLYIDNPVGTGFSFTDDRVECYSKDQNDIRKDLYSALIQFFQLFPDLQKNDLFLCGESYAGKYIPALAYSIHENNPNSEVKMNLKGLGIGSGFLDPVNMMVYSKYLYQLGFSDKNELIYFSEMENEVIELIKNEQWKNASQLILSIVHDKIYRLTGDVSKENYMKMRRFTIIERAYEAYLKNAKIACMIHTGNATLSDGMDSFRHMLIDFSKSVKPWIEELVEHYRIIIFNGQFDLIVGSPLTKNFIAHLNWSGAEDFKKSKKVILKDKDSLTTTAYVKTFKNLNVAVIRNAGHMAFVDQPEWTYDVIDKYLIHPAPNVQEKET